MTYINAHATPADELARLTAMPSSSLAAAILNDELNRFIANHSGHVFEALAGEEVTESPIPFQGWYWRAVDFFNPRGITIAEGDGQVGVCENNKWDYPARYLTDDEQAHFLGLVWTAYAESRKGGSLADINKTTHAALVKAGEYIAAMHVPPRADW